MFRNARFFGILLALIIGAGGLSGCNEQIPLIRSVPVHAATKIERKETIEALRDAWRARGRLVGSKGRYAEQSFLIRLAGTIKQFEDTESYGDICALWNQCLGEHQARFPESGR